MKIISVTLGIVPILYDMTDHVGFSAIISLEV